LSLRALFFDAGNTLLFPDTELTLAPLIARGIHPTEEALRSSERAVRDRDKHPQGSTDDARGSRGYWSIYFDQLFSTLNLPADPELQKELIACCHKSTNWRRIVPRTCEILLELKRDYRLGVISNSDGGVRQALAVAGIGDCFECVIDSANVGFEKPNPAIFRAALTAMNVRPDESVYVGDVYSIDILGAQAAGIRGILMDAYCVSVQDSCPRISSLAELPLLLRNLSDTGFTQVT